MSSSCPGSWRFDVSTHPVTTPPDATERDALDIVARLALQAEHRIRACSVDWDARALVFDPDLSLAEQAQLATLVSVSRSPVQLTPAEYAAVRAQMQTLRALRQMTRAEFMALTAAERDRATYDALVAVTETLLAILRD